MDRRRSDTPGTSPPNTTMRLFMVPARWSRGGPWERLVRVICLYMPIRERRSSTRRRCLTDCMNLCRRVLHNVMIWLVFPTSRNGLNNGYGRERYNGSTRYLISISPTLRRVPCFRWREEILWSFFRSISRFQNIICGFVSRITVVTILFKRLYNEDKIILLFRFIRTFLRTFCDSNRNSLFLFTVNFLRLFNGLLFDNGSFFFIYLLYLFHLFFFTWNFQICRLRDRSVGNYGGRRYLRQTGVLCALAASRISGRMPQAMRRFRGNASGTVVCVRRTSNGIFGHIARPVT